MVSSKKKKIYEKVFELVFFSILGCVNIVQNITPKKKIVFLLLFGS